MIWFPCRLAALASDRSVCSDVIVASKLSTVVLSRLMICMVVVVEVMCCVAVVAGGVMVWC